MKKVKLTRQQIFDLHSACNQAAVLPQVTTKLRYACARNIKTLSPVIEATRTAYPRPEAKGFDDALAAAKKADEEARQAHRKPDQTMDQLIEQAKQSHPEEVKRLEAWNEDLRKHLLGEEEVELFQLSVDDAGDLVDPSDGSVQAGVRAGSLTYQLLPIFSD